MIVWLASYPRSGNTLLRQVLQQCLGLGSFEQPGAAEVVAAEDVAAWEQIRAAYGNLTSTQAHAAFLVQARESPSNVLIKTHDLPTQDEEDERAIYVVRDGRLALQSYVKYQRTFQDGASSFVELLLGDHRYRDWTTHYRLWCEQRKGPTFLLRFEELVEAGPDLLGRLADFLGHRGEVRPWVNQQERLRKLSPAFFGPGSPRWRPDAFWTEERLRQFYTLHGPLLLQLGYADEATVSEGAHPPGDAEQFVQQSSRTTQKRWELQRVCDERELTIRLLRSACDEQEAEIELLRAACGERLALIDRLEKECQGRQAVIERLREQRRERQAAIERLQTTCDERQEQLRLLEEAYAPWRKLAAWLPGRRAA